MSIVPIAVIEHGTGDRAGLNIDNGLSTLSSPIDASLGTCGNDNEAGRTSAAFTINSTNLAGEAAVLVPDLSLARSCLPLSLICHEKRRLECFEADQGLINPISSTTHGSQFLVAEAPDKHTFVAIEHMYDNLYASHNLKPGTTRSNIDRLAGASVSFDHDQVSLSHPLLSTGEDWWRAISEDDAFLFQDWPAKGVGHIRPTPPVLVSSTGQALAEDNSAVADHSSVEVPDHSVLPAKTSKGGDLPDRDALHVVKSQYQEALYMSKAALAYFAKGPLSRARASHQQEDAPNDYSSLITSLRSMILSLNTMDKKYRETLPKMIGLLPFEAASENEEAAKPQSMTKERKKKSIKLNKDGLYANEAAAIEHWWRSRELPDGAAETAETRENYTNNIVIEQRSRETQLQIIIILEVMALESTNKACQNGGSTTEQSGPEAEAVTAKKPKRLQNLDTLLDLLVDRLGIWQSMSYEGLNHEEGDRVTSTARSKPSRPTSFDTLQQFCVDVVIPFYGARLPIKTKLICQKLGNAKDPSPRRPPLRRIASMNASTSQRDTIGSDGPPRKVRKTLERVLTDERPKHRRSVPSLSRSATDSGLPHIKREVSDTTLASIPYARNVMSKRYTQREVDLRTASQNVEAKLKRKAIIDNELKEAISALRKPNAREAVKDLVEDAERRIAGPQPRKFKAMARTLSTQSVQINATPRKERPSNVAINAQQYTQFQSSGMDVSEILPSSAERITCSTQKPGRAHDLAQRAIVQTPTKFRGAPASARTTSSDAMSSVPQKSLDPATRLCDSRVVGSFAIVERTPPKPVKYTNSSHDADSPCMFVTPLKRRLPL